ncbi:hypothetical protein P2318_26225 [Myxococcaceae bacterium GXIMD 01537]
MAQHFFDLHDDVYVPRRWHLSIPTDLQGQQVDEYALRRGTPVSLKERLRIPVGIAGTPLDYTEAGIGVPVVHVRVADVFAALAPDDVQLIPVDVEGHPDQFLILVATRLIRCIDEARSSIQLWTDEDGLPDMVGKYFSVRDMRIDRSKVGDAKVFRPEGWSGSLIISGSIKSALKRMGATGVKFKGV